MINLHIVKHIKDILLLRQVGQAWKAETGKEKPKGLSRTFIGTIITVASTLVGSYLALDISGDLQTQIINHVVNVRDSVLIIMGEIKKLIPELLALYGILMLLLGRFRQQKEDRRKR